MKLEQQVASLELCKKLKELGVKQEGAFYWTDRKTLTRHESSYSYVHYHDEGSNEVIRKMPFTKNLSAFTVAELGKMLPVYANGKYMGSFPSRENENHLSSGIPTKWVWGFDTPYQEEHITADTEADARAKMLIYLLENKLITL